MLFQKKFIAFFLIFHYLANKTQLNNSRRGVEIFFKGATVAFPRNKFIKIRFLLITRI